MNHRKHVGDINLFDYTGKYCFDLLIGLNLQKNHKLLDVGCGA
jgi:hypothetical protein